MKLDLNADLGEGAGQDAGLLRLVTSANICAGLHAGSPAETGRALRAAAAAGVGLGVHPGFDDRAHLGRRRLSLARDEITALIAYQTGAMVALARANGLKLAHFKLHGALANMAAEDAALARLCYQTARAIAPDLRLVVIAATAQEAAAEDIGAPWAGEIFADRGYNADATLIERSLPGALLHDPDAAATRILAMLRAGAIIAADGTRIPAKIDTVCLHGDTPEALAMAVDCARSFRPKGWCCRASEGNRAPNAPRAGPAPRRQGQAAPS